MASVLTSSAVDHGIEPRSGQTKEYKIGICCFSAKHTALRRKSKDLLARNQNNVSEWSDRSILYSLVWPDRGSIPWSTALEVSTLAIKPPMWFLIMSSLTYRYILGFIVMYMNVYSFSDLANLVKIKIIKNLHLWNYSNNLNQAWQNIHWLVPMTQSLFPRQRSWEGI
jgi:hypothetical protein